MSRLLSLILGLLAVGMVVAAGVELNRRANNETTSASSSSPTPTASSLPAPTAAAETAAPAQTGAPAATTPLRSPAGPTSSVAPPATPAATPDSSIIAAGPSVGSSNTPHTGGGAVQGGVLVLALAAMLRSGVWFTFRRRS